VVQRLAVAALSACVASTLGACGGTAQPAAVVIHPSPSVAVSPETKPSPRPSPLISPSPRAVARPQSPQPVKPPPPRCATFVMRSFTAQSLGYREATIRWSTGGGCAPFSGYVAGFVSVTGESWHHPIRSASGSITDPVSTLGIDCVPYPGARTVGVTYNLWLNDGTGHLVGAGPSTRLVMIQVC
jgi:hypothetical protein